MKQITNLQVHINQDWNVACVKYFTNNYKHCYKHKIYLNFQIVETRKQLNLIPIIATIDTKVM